MGALGAGTEEEGEQIGEPGAAEDEGDEAEEGRYLSEEDGAEAVSAALLDGFAEGHAVGFEGVDFVDEDEGIIDDDTADAEDAEHGHDADGEAVEEVAEDGADDAEGEDEEDDEGLGVAAEGDGHEGVHGAEDDEEGDEHLAAAFLLLAGFAFEAPFDVAVAGEEVVEVASEFEAEGVDVGGAFVEVGGDVEGAAAVDAFDAGEAFGNGGFGDTAEGDLEAGSGADAHGVEGGEVFALVLGEFEHDFDFVAAALDALDFIAIEGLADLAGEVVDGDAELAGFGFEAELDFVSTGVEGVVDVEERGVFGELGFDLLGDGEEFFGVGAGELDVDGVATAHDFGAEGDFLGADDGANEFAPFVGDGDGVDVEGAFFGAEGFHDDAADVGAGAVAHAAAAGHGGAGGGDDVFDDGVAVGVGVFALEVEGDVVDALDLGVGDFVGGAVEHGEAAFDALAGDAGEVGGLDVAAGVEAAEDEEAAEHEGEHGVAVLGAEADGGAVEGVDDPLEAAAGGAMDGGEEIANAAEEGVGEVAGEDQLCFQESDHHDGDEDDGDGFEHAAPVGGVHGHGEEGDDGGEDAEGDGDGHAAGAGDGGLEGAHAFASEVVAMLTDDDGVIDDDAEDEDEAHQGGEVDGDVHVGHEGEGAEEAHDHADGDPDDGFEAEEEADADEDEDEAGGGVLAEEVDAAFDDFGAVVPVVELDAFGEAFVGGVDVFFDAVANGDGVLHAFAHDGDHDAGAAVEFDDEGVFGEAVEDFGDFAEEEFGAVRFGENRDLGEVGASVGASAGADGDVAGFGLDDTGGEVDGIFADGAGDDLEVEVVFAEGFFGDLDGDFLGARAGEFGVGDAWEGGEFVAGLFAEAFEVALGHVGAEDDGDDGVEGVVELDDGFFGEGGEGGDGVEADFDVFEDGAGVLAFFDFDDDVAAGAAGGGVDVFDAADLLDGFLDFDDDGFLGFFGGGGGVGDVDGDEAGGDVLEDFDGDFIHPQGPDAGDHDGEHEEIGGDAVASEPGDHRGRGAVISDQ